MWSSFKAIRALVLDVFCNGKENRILELESTLERHKEFLLSPLQTQPKSQENREAVKKALTESINLPGIPQRILLTEDFVQEVLILSDLFNTDELIIVELLLTAESQIPTQTDSSRGLLAVLLFYDAQQAIVDCLRTLIQARDGRTWSPSLSSEAVRIAERFTGDLWKNGLLHNILGSLKKFDILRKFSQLEKAQALGSSKHRYDVYNLLSGIQNGLSECLLLWACQSAFTLDEFRLVLDYLLQPRADSPQPTAAETEQFGPPCERLSVDFPHAQVHVLMALLYTLEPFTVLSSPPEQPTDLTSIVSMDRFVLFPRFLLLDTDLAHPLFADCQFGSGVSQLLDRQKDRLGKSSAEDTSDHSAVLGLLRLSWSLCLRRSINLRSELSRHSRGRSTRSPTASPNLRTEENVRDATSDEYGMDEDDEAHANLAIESGALEFIRKRLLAVAGFEREPLWVCRLHGLITDLLVYMPARVKEIRLKDEDLIRRTGFNPSSSGSGFANFLLLIAELYNQPGSKLHARLALEYWWPAGELAGVVMTGGGTASQSNTTELLLAGGFLTRSPSKSNVLGVPARATESDNIRQASLFRFVRSVGDMVSTSNLFIPYLRMLHGLIGSRSSAGLCFSLLKANANNPGRTASLASWDHFFASFRQYLSHMKQTASAPVAASSQPSGQVAHHQIYPHLYNVTNTGGSNLTVTGSASVLNVAGGVACAIQPEEQAGLQVVLRLVARIARMDPVARSLFASNTNWQTVPTCLGLLTCSIPLVLKADLIHVLTSLSRSVSIAASIWRHVITSDTEMDEVEPRAEEYPITRAFLSFVTVLAPQLIHSLWNGSNTTRLSPDVPRDSVQDESALQQGHALIPLVSFLTNTVFLKHTMRVYRDHNERWDIAASCLVLFDGLVGQFIRRLDAVAAAVTDTDSRSTRSDGRELQPVDKTTATITGLLEVGLHRILEFPLIDGPPVGMLRATASGLRLIQRLLANEEILITFVRRAAVGPPLAAQFLGMSKPVPFVDQFSSTVLPTCLSRLLLSINSRTGRSDLLSMLLRYCSLSEELPDHSGCALGILGLLLGRIKPHSDMLAVLTAERDTQRHLMTTFSSLIKWPISPGLPDVQRPHSTTVSPISADADGMTMCFTDEWLFGTDDEIEPTQLTCLGVSSISIPHPATRAARLYAAIPLQPPNWSSGLSDWELLAAWPPTSPSVLTPLVCTGDGGQLISSYNSSNCSRPVGVANWLFDWLVGQQPLPFGVHLLHILLASLDFPAPNLSHWLLGFRIDSAQTVKQTTLQDAGIGDQPRTCLHAIIDLIDIGLRLGASVTSLPKRFALTLQWSLAMAWQLVYRLAASPLTSEPVLRFLRGNHDLLAKHLQFGLHQPTACLPDSGLTTPDDSVLISNLSPQYALEFLSLNQASWFLRTLAIELRTAAHGSQRSYVSKLLKLFFGDLLTDASERELDFSSESSPTLNSFLSRLKLYESLCGPDSFELHSFDASIVDELVWDCEVVSPLLVSDSLAVRKVSTLLNSRVLLNRLYLKLLIARMKVNPVSAEQLAGVFATADQSDPVQSVAIHNPPTESGGLAILAKDVANLHRWIEARNIYRLRLYAGKQAAFEAWRQLVEIGSGLIATNPATSFPLVPFTSSHSPSSALLSLVTDFGGGTIVSGNESVRRARACSSSLVSLTVCHRLLVELCASENTPSTIRLLASGTVLHLASYLASDQVTASWTDVNGQSVTTIKQAASLLTRIVLLLVRLTLQTKSSAQRMRANLYGALCFMLGFGRLLSHCDSEDSSFSNVHLIPNECLSAIKTGFKIPQFSHWSQTELLKGSDFTGVPALYCLLAWDLVRGHVITQMAVLSLLESMLFIDRSPRDLLSFLCCQTVLQHLVDSIPEDLGAVETFLMSSSLLCTDVVTSDEDMTNAATVVTTAFHMYRAKLSLMCRLATGPVGAKALSQSNIVTSLAGCTIFSASTLANSYADGLDTLYSTVDSMPQKSTGGVVHTLMRKVSRLQPILADTSSSDESVLHKLLNSISADEANGSEDSGISWSGILLPAVRLFKTLLITLGPNHVGVSQQVFNFLYTHSDALLSEDTSLGSALIHFLSSSRPVSSMPGIGWLLQWLAAQTSLTGLFVLVCRCQPSTLGDNTDEYSTLQREVVQARIVRHTLNFLSTVIVDDASVLGNEFRPSTTVSSQRSSIGLEHLLCETQQLQLVCQLISVFTASLSCTESILPAGIKSPGPRPLHSLLSLPLHGDPNGTQTGLTFVFRLLSWTFMNLTRLEEVCSGLANLNLFTTLSKSEDVCPTVRKQTEIDYLHRTGHTVARWLLLASGCRRTSTGNGVSKGFRINRDQLVAAAAEFTHRSSSQTRLTLLTFRYTIDMCQQLAYILWRNLDHQVNSTDAGVSDSFVQTLQKSVTPHHRSAIRRLQDGPVPGSVVNPSPRQMAVAGEVSTEMKNERAALKQQLPSLLTPHLFDSMDVFSKAAYLEENQRLFMQAMRQRLERLALRTVIQTVEIS
ncbi:nuclear pore complex protein Nup205 [Paragonimus westermani]|uniref:Nuclear pore complex protein Nup205 n=1 Tax=Paragonimus westermani TaxID=34504 RepID=A0A5J4NT01_9TREM|nr:nuclear pore complex protein Nup205 [Paragonimus westermani]